MNGSLRIAEVFVHKGKVPLLVLETWCDSKPAAFLDRDGLIVEDAGYGCDPAAIAWIPGAVAAIRRLRAEGYAPIVATNQSGVARGYFSQADLDRYHAVLAARLAAMDAPLAAIAWCPHGPEAVCSCRKPLPGLLEQAFATLPLTREGSFMVGDRDSDAAAGTAAGIRGLVFPGGNLDEFLLASGAVLRACE